MADTTLVNQNNRFLDEAFLRAGVASVPLDAMVAETFFLPVGFGQLHIKFVGVLLGLFTGTYVAPAPAYDGAEVYILSSDLSTRIDGIGAKNWTNVGTITARPQLSCSFDMQNFVLMRQSDRITITAPIMAGAGITGTLQVTIRGRRMMTA